MKQAGVAVAVSLRQCVDKLQQQRHQQQQQQTESLTAGAPIHALSLALALSHKHTRTQHAGRYRGRHTQADCYGNSYSRTVDKILILYEYKQQ